MNRITFAALTILSLQCNPLHAAKSDTPRTQEELAELRENDLMIREEIAQKQNSINNTLLAIDTSENRIDKITQALANLEEEQHEIALKLWSSWKVPVNLWSGWKMHKKNLRLRDMRTSLRKKVVELKGELKKLRTEKNELWQASAKIGRTISYETHRTPPAPNVIKPVITSDQDKN